MDEKTIKAMVKLAKKAGICQISYAGMSSGGLYSSSNPTRTLYLTKYPATFTKEFGNDVDLKQFLDKVDVCDGFVKVELNHLCNAGDKDDEKKAKVVVPKVSRYGTHYKAHLKQTCIPLQDYGKDTGEECHTILIPFNNILSIIF